MCLYAEDVCVTYNLVELLVLLIGIVGEVVIQVVLRYRVYYVVCHIQIIYYMKL